jgi:hypothetical protein
VGGPDWQLTHASAAGEKLGSFSRMLGWRYNPAFDPSLALQFSGLDKHRGDVPSKGTASQAKRFKFPT